MGTTQRQRSSIFITPHPEPSHAARPRRRPAGRPPTSPPPQRRRYSWDVFGSIACRSRPPGSNHTPQQRQKLGAHPVEIQRISAGMPFGHSHQIGMGWQEIGMQAKKFTQQTFYAITNHRIAHFAGNSHARARQLAGALSRKHKKEEMLCMVTPAALIAGGKFRPATNTDMPWKAQTRHQNPRRAARTLTPRLRRSDACAPWRDAGAEWRDRWAWPYGRGNRGCGLF